jgi:hypothetical protein
MRRGAPRVARTREAGGSPSGPLDRQALRWRFWVEAVATFVAGVIAVLTLLAADWAEELFGIEPDQGSGLFEVSVTVIAVLIAVGCGLAARLEWHGRVSRDPSGEIDGGAA